MNAHEPKLTPYQAGVAAQSELPPLLHKQIPPPLPGDIKHIDPEPENTHPEVAESRLGTDPYPKILRWVGAGTLGISALCFLITGWVDGSPILRMGSFLGFTALMSLAGVFCAWRWQEDKGARTFLALATAFLPANFAQLGALIYAQMPGGPLAHSSGIRGVFTFDPVGTSALLISGLVSLAVLVPVAFTGFSALARSSAKKITALFLASNTLLLLPFREANLVALICAGAAAGLVLADRKWFAKETALRTWDGIAMRSLLFAPIAVLFIRNLVMHDITPGMASVGMAMVALLCFAGLPRCLPWKAARMSSQFVAYAFAWLSWMTALLQVFPYDTWSHFWEGSILPIIFLPWCIFVFGLSFKSEGKGVAARGLTSIIAVAVCWTNIEWFGHLGYTSSILAILTAVALLLVAFVLEERTVLAAGVVLLIVAIGYHVHFALSLVQQNLWLSLALAGSSVILASSYLERHGIGLRQRALRLRKHWQAWN